MLKLWQAGLLLHTALSKGAMPSITAASLPASATAWRPPLPSFHILQVQQPEALRCVGSGGTSQQSGTSPCSFLPLPRLWPATATASATCEPAHA